jgi:cell division protein FtsW
MSKVSSQQDLGATKVMPTRKENTHTKDGQRYFDFNLLIIVIFLVSFGLVILYSASAHHGQMMFGDDMHFFSRQAMIILASVAGMLVISFINYRFYAKIAGFIYVFALGLMALVRTSLGVEIGGARRWLAITPDIQIQPSEFSKLALIIFLSYLICRYGKRAYSLKGTFRIMAFAIIMALAVFILNENFGTAIIIIAIAVGLYFVIHPNYKLFISLLAIGGVIVWLLLRFLSTAMFDSYDFRMNRILIWLNPEGQGEAGAFQINQGLYAIGSGGFWGRGLGNGTQKLGAIPEVHNDMIFAVIAEELGIFGVFILLLMFGMLLYRLMFIAQNAPDLLGSLLATGIFIHIAVQVIMNVAVVTNLLPTTGITLPFISFGGTSIMFLMAEMGIALGISRQIVLTE